MLWRSERSGNSSGRASPLRSGHLGGFHLIAKLQHFNRERIPERVVHAKGSGAFGIFTVTHDITPYTKAKLFSQVGKQTKTFVLRTAEPRGSRSVSALPRSPPTVEKRLYRVGTNHQHLPVNRPRCRFGNQQRDGAMAIHSGEAARNGSALARRP